MKEKIEPLTKDEFINKAIESAKNCCTIKNLEKFKEALLELFEKIRKKEIEIKGLYIPTPSENEEIKTIYEEILSSIEITNKEDEEKLKNWLRYFIFSAQAYQIKD